MSYFIRVIDFTGKKVPSITTIAESFESNSSQKIVISRTEFKNQYLAKLVKYPEDVLNFTIKENEIVISGYAYSAPALFEIFYANLMLLGGKPLKELSILKFPISETEIERINTKVRKDISVFGLIFWLLIMVSLVLIIGVIYLFFSWV